ncbi:hypothetical protein ACJU26_03535 [Acidithiobacillus sp. M4-SHS-6]|uniref:hypothetical protein n=1 Tax=Acidithiobacillus sp. M4-SHS-6 TaxID=3383024 RepID=UPI0039BEA222
MYTLPAPTYNTEKHKQIIKEVHLANNKTVVVTMNGQLFDALCLCLGNAYKADSWLAMRVFEVGDLSDNTIRSYLRAMFREALSRHEPIQGITTEESRISAVTSHLVQ